MSLEHAIQVIESGEAHQGLFLDLEDKNIGAE
jgi:hypothetical protein